MYEDLAEFSVKYAEKNKASYAEARLESGEGIDISLKNGIVQGLGFDNYNGIGVRIVYGGQPVFFSTSELDKKKIKTLIKEAISIAKVTSNMFNEKIKFQQEDIHKAKYEVKEKIKLANIDVKEKIAYLKSVNDVWDKKTVPNSFISYSDGTTKTYYVNSEGTQIESKMPMASMYYLFTVKKGTETSQRYFPYSVVRGWEWQKMFDLPKFAKAESQELYKILTRGVRAPIGTMDLVVGPEVVGIMSHESVGHPYEADRILGREAAQAGESFVSPDMLGTRIGSEVVTVVDNPTVEHLPGYYLYDAEGVKARSKILIKNGIINEFLHNRQTAAEFNVRSNGGARVSNYDREPIVRMSNTYVLPGDHSEQELIEDIKRGIYIRTFMEWNIDDKRLNQKYVGAEAYLINNGHVSKPIKNPVIEITTPQLWSSVDAVGKDLGFISGDCGKGEPMQGVPVSMGGPHIRLRKVRFS